jgi:S-formylglutathione hydrolase FrmB
MTAGESTGITLANNQHEVMSRLLGSSTSLSAFTVKFPVAAGAGRPPGQKRSTGLVHRNPFLTGQPMRPLITALTLLALAAPGQAQFLDRVNLERVNHRLAGRVIDYTHNHGSDRRIDSRILGMPRDLYVYLPPGYNPSCSYPLVLFFHMAIVDEHYFVRSKLLCIVDELILRGQFPPAVIACPDGTYDNAKHSFYVNGRGGRFADHILCEVIPFLLANYSIRPEREAHAILGVSAGAYGAMGLAIDHRDFFGAVATLAGALNLRYSNCQGDYFKNFNPVTYRWKTHYDPNEVIGISHLGLLRLRAGRFMTPVFGDDSASVERIIATNPADKLLASDIRSGQLAIYVNYPGRDSFNFDAQDESFQWFAAGRGIDITVVCDPGATHSLRYLRANLPSAFIWLGQHLLPPIPNSLPVAGGPSISPTR